MSKRWPPWKPAPWDHTGQCVLMLEKYVYDGLINPPPPLTPRITALMARESSIVGNLVARTVDPLEGIIAQGGYIIPKAPSVEFGR